MFSVVVDAARQSWPPFVLVAGLLLIGQVANDEGLFEAIAAALARAPLSPRVLLVALLGLVATVTALLNLDTSVVFLTPVLVHTARRRGLDERPFLYGAVFMSNAASLILPGANLTNLLVLSGQHVSGAAFAARMLPASAAATVLTATIIVVAFPLHDGVTTDNAVAGLRFGVGAAAALVAAALVLVLANPALPVLALGVLAVTLHRRRPTLDPRPLVLLFALAVTLGSVARSWSGPGQLLDQLGSWPTAALAAGTSIVVNNLPAAVLYSAHTPPHPRALLIGLNLGPNLAVTGSLSAYLWWQAARSVSAHPSIRTYTVLGLAVVPITIAAAVFALCLFAGHGL